MSTFKLNLKEVDFFKANHFFNLQKIQNTDLSSSINISSDIVVNFNRAIDELENILDSFSNILCLSEQAIWSLLVDNENLRENLSKYQKKKKLNKLKS